MGEPPENAVGKSTADNGIWIYEPRNVKTLSAIQRDRRTVDKRPKAAA
jgi:hypothetical protein